MIFLILLFLARIAFYPSTVNALFDLVIFILTLTWENKSHPGPVNGNCDRVVPSNIVSWENGTVPWVRLTVFLTVSFLALLFLGKVALYLVY